ncbi:MAG: hypothetical protein ACE5GD_10060, partial [Candidatus Geothermarchaeales archaeon]
EANRDSNAGGGSVVHECGDLGSDRHPGNIDRWDSVPICAEQKGSSQRNGIKQQLAWKFPTVSFFKLTSFFKDKSGINNVSRSKVK